ncbi:hypothetical protein HZP35_15265 [Elizabethkingia anophelis]|nr:hypothetical protein [Elizabethkingia anophelis]MCT4170621.1 hypothetical protein [Elizabethkingia anophelis]MCT4245037.1 hypothetical protein [Elizabethkingia anophelis]MCT4248842.1 hypothetical protein [Elizabethkingia anophelis]MCT4259761.1 hypothetical protein [Elizabethkingia anophelis]
MNKKEKIITNNNIEVSQRVLNELLSYLKHNPSRLAKELGYKSNVKIQHIKSGRNGISAEVASDITNKYPEINYNWLLTGKGEMLNTKAINYKKEESTSFEKLPIEDKLNSIYELLINSSTDSSSSVESLIHGLISKDAHQDKYINFMRDKIIELENSLESQKNMTIQILEIVKDLKLSTH